MYDPQYEFTPIEWTWVTDQLEKSRNYWIATTSANGAPHAAPVWGVWLNDRLYFGSDPASTKARNIARDPRASANLESGDNVVILRGEIHPVANPAEAAKATEAYLAKYKIDLTPENSDDTAAFYALATHTALAWRETDFPKTATRWKF